MSELERDESVSTSPTQITAQGGLTLPRGLRGLLKYCYTNNPFYVVSAALVLAGVRVSIEANGGATQPWLLMGVLATYTLAIAFAACLVIRIGRIWQDGRTVLLTLVVMFLAMSMIMDEILIHDPVLGGSLLAFGFGFSLAISEATLRIVRLRLPILYRLPFYLMIGTFYGYPYVLSRLVVASEPRTLAWAVVSFAPANAILLLALVPAVRQGPNYVRENGTPWGWPLYPWTLFFFVGFGVCVRSYLLCLSSEPRPGADSIFAPYFLGPYLLAVCALMLEHGIKSRQRWLQQTSLVLAMLIIPLAGIQMHNDQVSIAFLNTLTNALGSPLFLTVGAVVVLHTIAVIRRVAGAETGLGVLLLLASIVGPRTIDGFTTVAPQLLPIASLTMLQIWLAWRQRCSWNLFVAAAGLIAVLSIALADTAFLGTNGNIPLHMLFAVAVVVSLRFADSFARLLENVAGLGAIGISVSIILVRPAWLDSMPTWLFASYALSQTIVAIAHWHVRGNRLYLFAGILNLIGGCGQVVWLVYHWLATVLRLKGLWLIFSGIVSLIVAIIVSLSKDPQIRALIGSLMNNCRNSKAGS